jgi:hypothetical protein
MDFMHEFLSVKSENVLIRQSMSLTILSIVYFCSSLKATTKAEQIKAFAGYQSLKQD